MSQATNYAQLFDIETPVELACQTALAQLGVVCLTSRQNVTLPGTRVDVMLRLGATTGHMGIIGTFNGVPQYSRDTFTASLEFQIVTPRTIPDLRAHGFMRASVRQIMQPFWNTFALPALPLHNLVDAMDSGTVPSLESGPDEDASQVSWNCTIAIRPTAWPALS